MTKSSPSSSGALFDFPRARAALLRWFDANGRVFPWREEPSPYRVWISEIMLQQTTTQTVVDYFERFVRRFPDAAALARASEEETLKYWEGLGYYRRAKMLRAAAIEIVAKHNGAFPSDYASALALPGIGRYAAGAILSFGFDKRFPILEANTTRLHARLLGLRAETSLAESQRVLWQFAEDWLPRETLRREPNVYRKLNGALTDLGRLVCSPGEPNCRACPLAKWCEAERLGLQAVTPVMKKKAEPIRRTDVALWIARADLPGATRVAETSGDAKAKSGRQTDVLLVRRPQGALWAGLWDFPRFPVAEPFANAHELSGDAVLADYLQYFLETEAGAPGRDYRAGEVLTTVRHAVTKYRVALRVARLAGASPAVKRTPSLFDALESEPAAPFFARSAAQGPEVARPREVPRQGDKLRWVPLESLESLPLSSPGRRVARFIVGAVDK